MSSFPSFIDRDKQWGAVSGRPFQQYEPTSFAQASTTRTPHSDVVPGLPDHDWTDTTTKRSIDKILRVEDFERPQGKPLAESLSDSQGLSNDSGNEDDSEEKHRESKRPRMAISCSECRRRKIKCDRNIPCMACVRRGMPGSCRWENAKVEPSPQPFALKTQVDDLQRRLDSLQESLRSLPAEIVKAITMAQGPSNPDISLPKRGTDHQDSREVLPHDGQLSKGKLPTGGSTSTNSGPPAIAPSAALSATRSNVAPSKGLSAFYDDAAENAAVVLESIAFNPQTNEPDSGNDSMISHEYWRGNMLTPSSGAALAGSAKDDPPKLRHQREQQVQEYTSALTSIVAPPWDITLDRFNPVLMQQRGIEPDTPQQLMRQKLDAMNNIIENLPSLSQSYYLAEQYKSIIHWRSRILHWPSFQAELNYFWDMFAQQRQTEVDPLWLAVFFMVMALALDNRSTAPTGPNHPFHGYTHERLSEITNKYHAVSLKALYLGDAMSTPRIRTIQTVILSNSFFQSSSAWRKADMMLNWNALASRTAQLMGLHRLGNNPETMPPDDPAWPPGKNAVKRYMGLRVWMMVQWSDWMSASARFRCYTIHPDQCTSQVVDNVDDWELSPTEWRYTARPAHIVTSSSFEVYKWNIANMLRQTFDKLITYADRFSYSAVLELDAGYRKILEGLPEAYRREDPLIDNNDPKIRRQRNIALEGIHARIVRLNRPFLSRGYSKDSKFALSRDNCLNSARIVIDCHYNLRDLTTSGSLWFVYSHTLSAAMVLFLDLFWAIDHNLSPNEIDDRTRTIYMVREIFSLYSEISNTSLRRIVESAFRIISELISESQSRRSAGRASTFNLATQDPLGGNPAPFSEVLRRISRDMTLGKPSPSVEGPRAPAPIPSQLPPDSYQQPPFPSHTTGKEYEQQPPQEFLGSGFYNALGVQDESNPTFANFWNFNTSPSDSQSDLSFLNVYPGVESDGGDPYGLWQYFVGQDLL